MFPPVKCPLSWVTWWVTGEKFYKWLVCKALFFSRYLTGGRVTVWKVNFSNTEYKTGTRIHWLNDPSDPTHVVLGLYEKPVKVQVRSWGSGVTCLLCLFVECKMEFGCRRRDYGDTHDPRFWPPVVLFKIPGINRFYTRPGVLKFWEPRRHRRRESQGP